MISEIKAGAILNYINIFLRIGIGAFLNPFILYHLGKSEFGLYTIAGTIVSYIALMDFGLTASIGKFLSEYQANKDLKGEAHFLGNVTAIFSTVAIAILLIGGVIYFFLDNIFPNFTKSELSTYQTLYLLALCNTAFCFPLNAMGGVLTSRSKFIIPGVVRTGLSLLNVIGTILVLILGYKSIALLSVNIITGIAGLAINTVYAFSFLGVRLSWNGWDLPLCKKVYAFSGWVFVAYLSGVLNWGTGGFILGMTCTPEDIAVFSFGMAIFSYYYTFSSSIPSLFTARIVKMVVSKSDSKELTLLMSQVSRVLISLLLLMLSGIILFGQEFLHLWVGESLKERTNESWLVAVVLCSGATISLTQGVGGQIIQAKNLVKDNARVQIIIALSCSILAYYLSISYGALAIAASTALSYIIGQVFYTNWIYHKKAGINLTLYYSTILKKLLLSLIFPITAGIMLNLSISDSTWFTLISKIVTMSIIHILSFYFLYLNENERHSYLLCIFQK